MSSDNPTKFCSKCQQYKPATIEYFSRLKSSKTGFASYCKDCNHKWAKDNREKIAARQREYRSSNPEYVDRVNEARRKAYKENPEKILERNKQWRKDNPEQLHEYRKQKWANNKEELTAKNRAWKDANLSRLAAYGRMRYHNDPEYRARHQAATAKSVNKYRLRYKLTTKVYKSSSRAIENGVENKLEKTDFLYLYEEQDGRCGYCGIPFSIHIPNQMHHDHMMPLSKGGPNTIDNVVMCCIHCNSSKNNKTLEEWQKVRGW